MESIIDKLTKINNNNSWNNWTLEEKKQILQIYLIMSQKENHIFDLIYNYHGCDSWEDIFRDYDSTYLKDKTKGVKIAIDEINKIIKSSNQRSVKN